MVTVQESATSGEGQKLLVTQLQILHNLPHLKSHMLPGNTKPAATLKRVSTTLCHD